MSDYARHYDIVTRRATYSVTAYEHDGTRHTLKQDEGDEATRPESGTCCDCGEPVEAAWRAFPRPRWCMPDRCPDCAEIHHRAEQERDEQQQAAERLASRGDRRMSDERTSKELAGIVRDDFLWLEGVAGAPHGQAVLDALDELVHRADEGEKLRELAEAAHVVARLYGETLCQGNEGRDFLDAVDAVFPKEADE